MQFDVFCISFYKHLVPVICATLDLFTKFRTKLFQESFHIQMLYRREKNMVIDKFDSGCEILPYVQSVQFILRSFKIRALNYN